MSGPNFNLDRLVEAQGATVEKSMVFAGGTTDDPGDYDGIGNPAPLFIVTGVVAVKLFAMCLIDLVGASATLKVGTALSNAALLPQTTGTDLDANDIWHDATPDATTELTSVLTEKIVSDDIIQTAAAANVTAGELQYICIWRPISKGATVVAA